MIVSKFSDYLGDATRTVARGAIKTGEAGKIAARMAGRQGKKVAGGVTKVNKTIDKGIDKVAGVGAKGVVGVGKGMTRKTDPGIANLWTGRRESGGAVLAAGVVGAGYAGYQGMKQTTLAPKTGEVSYGGTAPIMNADGVSSTSQAPTLGASGTTVFGLHSARRG